MKKDKLFAFIWNENVIAFFLFLFSFGVYLITMSRSVGMTDSGELAAVICTLGIAHPTGYPLFTLLGRLWILLPIHLEEIIRLNIFSALLTASSVGIFFKSTCALFRAKNLSNSKIQKQVNLDNHRTLIASAVASLAIAFSTTFWLQSTNLEVYALHLVLILLAFWTFLIGLEEQLNGISFISNKLFLSAFIIGLSFANHMTTILLVPGFIWLFFHTFGWQKESFKLSLKLIPFFIVGISIYLYLPIRSASRPMFDWGHPATIERFIWHVSGKQFRVWMFSGWSVVQKQINYYFNNFISEFSIIIIVFFLIGLILLWKRSRHLFIFLLILFLTTIMYSVNYDIFDIDTYFLLSYIVVAWILAFTVNFLIEWYEDKESWKKITIKLILIAIPILQIGLNFEKCNGKRYRLPQEFVENVFQSLEPNSVVIATQWDYFISPSYYYQFIKNRRPDVTIIDKSLLQNRTWYFLQLNSQAKWLMERIRQSVNLFLVELSKFEKGQPFQYDIINACWQNLLNEIVEQSLIDRPVYVDVRSINEFSPNFHRIPACLFIRLSNNAKNIEYKYIKTSFSPINKRNAAERDFEHYYVNALLYEANWLFLQKKLELAENRLNEILTIEPANPTVKWFKNKIAENK